MTSTLAAVRVDAADPSALASFWAAALGWEVATGGAGGAVDAVELVPTDGTRFGLRFVPGAEPKRAKNPIHLDLTTRSLEDQSATVATLLGLGARHADVGQGPDEPHVVLADPEGNELCIIEPGNSFLAGCGRLGSITCDGSRAAGVFWSEALGWPLVWDQDEETAVRTPEGTGPFVTWGPPPPPRAVRSRLRLELAAGPAGVDVEVERLVSLGASIVGDDGTDAVHLADPDGTEFVLLRNC